MSRPFLSAHRNKYLEDTNRQRVWLSGMRNEDENILDRGWLGSGHDSCCSIRNHPSYSTRTTKPRLSPLWFIPYLVLHRQSPPFCVILPCCVIEVHWYNSDFRSRPFRIFLSNGSKPHSMPLHPHITWIAEVWAESPWLEGHDSKISQSSKLSYRCLRYRNRRWNDTLPDAFPVARSSTPKTKQGVGRLASTRKWSQSSLTYALNSPS